MSKNKKKSKPGENQEETNNPRRDFLGKAAIVAAGLAVGSVVGGKQLLAQDKTIALNKEALFMEDDGKVYTGIGLLDHFGYSLPAQPEQTCSGTYTNCGTYSPCNGIHICDCLCRCDGFTFVWYAIATNAIQLGNGKIRRVDSKIPIPVIPPSSKAVIEKLKKQGRLITREQYDKIRINVISAPPDTSVKAIQGKKP